MSDVLNAQDEKSSADDAAVLKQELVSVQKMMDDVTREKERELDDLKRRFGAVEREKELLQNSSSAGHSEVDIVWGGTVQGDTSP